MGEFLSVCVCMCVCVCLRGARVRVRVCGRVRAWVCVSVSEYLFDQTIHNYVHLSYIKVG